MKLKSIAALSIAGLMALQMPITAFADLDAALIIPGTPAKQEHVEVDTTENSIGVYNMSLNVDATIKGDVKVKAGNGEAVEGVVSRAAGSTVTVLGDVIVENTKESGYAVGIHDLTGNVEADNVTVTGNSNVNGILINGNMKEAAVTVNGDITATSNSTTGKPSVDGIFIKDAISDVTVTSGNIIGTNTDPDGGATGIYISNDEGADAKITVECTGITLDAYYTSAIVATTHGADNEVTIHVNGEVSKTNVGADLNNISGKMDVTIDSDLEAEDFGLMINNKGKHTSVAVNGVVSADNEAAIMLGDTTAKNCEISVYGLKAGKKAQLSNSKAALAKVNYIVHGNDGSADYKNMTFDPSQVSTVTVNGKTYYTAKEGTITVTVGSGYTLKSTQAIAGSGNVYTVTIPQGGFVTLEAILAAVEQQEESNEEQKPVTTGSIGAPVSNGLWNCGPNGQWTYRTNGLFRDTWAYIANPYANAGQAKEGWFYFDKNGIMLTGWQEINGKWYYFNEVKDGTLGMLYVNTTTPDGRKVGADGALIQ